MFFLFCKQKTAYEMRISDWSLDVCSSDLGNFTGAARHIEDLFVVARLQTADEQVFPEAVHSSRHGVIHQIISGCHIAEDAADHAGLFTGVHIAIAEGCCFTHALSSSQVLQPPQRLLSPFLMPELPEVETTIAGLRPVLEGQVLTSVEPRRAEDRKSTRLNSVTNAHLVCR